MDSTTQAAIESEGPERARAVTELIESTLGIKIGPVEITEAAMSLSNEEKVKLAATLWEAAMPPMTEPTAGVYMLSASEHELVVDALKTLGRRSTGEDRGIAIARLVEKIIIGDAP